MAEQTTENVKESASKAVNNAPAEEVEDWDRMGDAEAAKDTTNGENQFNSFGRANGRSLVQLMSPHATGKDLQLTEEEEKKLEQELGNWVRQSLLLSSLLTPCR